MSSSSTVDYISICICFFNLHRFESSENHILKFLASTLCYLMLTQCSLYFRLQNIFSINKALDKVNSFYEPNLISLDTMKVHSSISICLLNDHKWLIISKKPKEGCTADVQMNIFVISNEFMSVELMATLKEDNNMRAVGKERAAWFNSSNEKGICKLQMSIHKLNAWHTFWYVGFAGWGQKRGTVLCNENGNLF